MKPLCNSVWETIEESLCELPGRFRILRVYKEEGLVVIFPIEKNKKLLRQPICCGLTFLTTCISKSLVEQSNFFLPDVMTLSDSELQDEWKESRDKNYQIVEPLVQDENFLLRMVSTPKFGEIGLRAKMLDLPPSTIHRLLNRYWLYGQIKAAFIPFYINCGSKGKQKTATYKKRGRPKKLSKSGFKVFSGVNVSDADKVKIKKSVIKHYKEGKLINKSAMWTTFLSEYEEEIFRAESQNRVAEIPNYRQFCYWLPMVVDEIALEKKRIGANIWEKDHRQLLGSVSENVHAPGDRYEIDSTVADVYIVSEIDRNRVLGKPVIYIIVDEASRMVVGLHVSIYWASLKEAKVALLNALLPKSDYCKQFGLNISDDEWPCFHIPRCLLADRAEFLGSTSEKHAGPLGIQVQLCRALRGDWKSVVERQFGIANEESLHHLAGTTRAQLRKRGESDPKDNAFYTISEVTNLLIRLFVERNKTKKLDCLITRDLIQENLAHTPLNYWNWHIEHCRDSLSLIDPDQARAELLPITTAAVTAKGISCGELWYTCDMAEKENWFVRARKSGTWKLSARIDENSSFLWVRPERGARLIRCTLLGRSRLYANLSSADVIYIQEWKANKEANADNLASKLRYAQVKEEIDIDVKNEIKTLVDKKKGKGGFK